METTLMHEGKKKSDIRNDFRAKHSVPAENTILLWQGSTTHYSSLILIKDAIDELLKDDKITIVLISNLEWLMSIGFKPHKKLIISGWVEFKDAYKLPALADISLVPLPNSKFNSCKSELKILESAAWKVPCIASSVAPYKRFHKLSNGGCLLIDNIPNNWIRQRSNYKNKQWINAVYSLIDNPDLYKSIVDKAYKAIEETYSLEVINKQRLEFWNKLKKSRLQLQ